MVLYEVAMPTYSEIVRARKWESLSESVNLPCGQNCSEIRTLKMSGVCGADENAAFYVSSASPSDVSDHPDHFVNRQTYPKGS